MHSFSSRNVNKNASKPGMPFAHNLSVLILWVKQQNRNLMNILVHVLYLNFKFQALFYMFVFRHKQLLDLDGGQWLLFTSLGNFSSSDLDSWIFMKEFSPILSKATLLNKMALERQILSCHHSIYVIICTRFLSGCLAAVFTSYCTVR